MATEIKITEKSAASLQWRGQPYIAWDAELDGFGVRVWGGGSKRGYIVQIKRGGRSLRKALGKVGEIAQEKARAKAIAFRGAVKDGRDPHAEAKAERGAWTVNDAMDHFRGAYADARKLAADYKADSDNLFKHHTPDRWKGMRLRDVTQPMVAARHREITSGTKNPNNRARGGGRRANAWLSLMSRLFTLGIAEGHCPLNPTTGIKENVETQRERFLSPSEISTLWRYLEKHDNVEAAVCVQFVLLTGCRPGEAYTMLWTDLDKSTGTWTKPASRTKQRKVHKVRLTDRALAVLDRLQTWKRSEYVFPSPSDASEPRGDKLKSFWRHVRKNCAFPDVRLYDCRHSFASWLAMGGATELEIAAQLGHANAQTTRRYVHIAQDHLKHKAGIMGEVIAKALADFSPDQSALVAEKKGSKVTIDGGIQVVDWDVVDHDES